MGDSAVQSTKLLMDAATVPFEQGNTCACQGETPCTFPLRPAPSRFGSGMHSLAGGK